MGTFARAENYILKKSESTALIVVFGIIYFTSQVIIGSILHKIGTLKALALQMTFCSDKFREIASAWIQSGEIDVYYRHFYFDSVHPVWYAIFLSLLIARAFKINEVNSEFNGIILTPFVAAFCDFFENAMHLYLLADLNRATPFLVALSGLATNTKWILAGLGVGTVAGLIVFWFVKKMTTGGK